MIDLRVSTLSERIKILTNCSLDQERTLRNECDRLTQYVETRCLSINSIDQDSSILKLNKSE